MKILKVCLILVLLLMLILVIRLQLQHYSKYYSKYCRYQPVSDMFTRQQQARSVGTLSRGKSVRRFGQDLTNLNLNPNPNYDTKKSEHVPVPKFAVNNYVEPMPQYMPSMMSVEINLMMDETVRNPLHDHLDDIMEYTLAQSFSICMEEDYMRWHSQINQDMREILINWLIRLQVQLKLHQKTLYLAIQLVDKYCYQQSILKSRYQLLGLACMFIAAKYEELATPRMSRFLEASDGLFKRQEVIDMEGEVLATVGFGVNRFGGLRELVFNRVDDIFRSFRHTSSAIEIQQQDLQIELNNVLHRCEYLIQLSLLQYKFTLIQPHYLSAVLLYISCKRQSIRTINSKFIIEKYNLSEKKFKDYFQLYIGLLRQKNGHKFKQVNKKYHYFCNDF